jgi:hypothetical protein
VNAVLQDAIAHCKGARGEAPLTREQLQLSYRHLCRPGWPDTLEGALAQPIAAAAIKGLARQLDRAPFSAGSRDVPRAFARPVGPPLPATPTQPPRLKPATKASWQPTFDARRAAANDRDD